MMTTRKPFPTRALCVAPALLLAAACVDGNGTPDAGPGIDGPLYALATTQFLPDGRVSLVGTVADPGAEDTFDDDTALEIGGSAAIFGSDGRSVFALGVGESPIITRYEVGDDGKLIEGDEVSLANAGVASAFKRPGLVPFISETKAYWLDDVTLQGVIWNPKEMSYDGTFSIAEVERDGLTFELGERAVVRDGLLYIGGRYRDGELDPGVGVALIIDTTTDTLVEVLEDERCGDTTHIVEHASGDLYFGTGTLGAVQYALGRPADYPAPCLLRIPAGEQAFDADFHVALPDLVEGRPVGRLVAGVDGHAYLLALEAEELEEPLSEDTDLYAPYDATAWRWWTFELGGSGAASLVDGTDITSASGQVLHAGGRDYIVQFSFESGRTTLLAASEGGGLEKGLDLPGYPYGLVRLR